MTSRLIIYVDGVIVVVLSNSCKCASSNFMKLSQVSILLLLSSPKTPNLQIHDNFFVD